MSDIKERINKQLETIKPFLEAHNGGVEIDHFDEKLGILYVRFLGSCSYCPLASLTYQNLIVDRLSGMKEIKEIKLIS